ncbi:MAG TPA: hypothetical protein VF884_12580 [Nitrososphaeraceae archaeon]
MILTNNHRPNNDFHHSNPSDIAFRLMEAPPDNHYLVIYPNLTAARSMYGDFIKIQIEQRNVAILFLPFFETTDKVRELLIIAGVDVFAHERNGSLILLDFGKIIDNPYLGIPAAFGLKEFVNKIQSRVVGKTLVVIADMSIYKHMNKVEDLLEYERLAHSDSETQQWKELCLFHKADFDLMFTESQKRKILEYHNGRTFLVEG